MNKITKIALAAVCMLAAVWLLTHDGCAHPLGNSLALLAYVVSGVSLLMPHLVTWMARNGLTGEGSDD